MGQLSVIETHNGFLINTGGYDEKKVADIKTIRGSGYRGDGNWFVPGYREREVRMLKEKYGIMTEPVIQMKQIVGEIPPLPELEVELNLKREPFPFQKPGIAYMLKHKRVIVADQMGLGKSQQSIGAAVAAGCKCTLVICPASLKLNWQNEWTQVAGKRSMILSDRTKGKWEAYYKAKVCDVFIVNYESLRKFFVMPGSDIGKSTPLKDITFKENIDMFDCIIIDESHRCKEPSTLQSKLCRGIAHGKEYIFCLTGTPILNKTKDIGYQLLILDKLHELVDHIPHPVKNEHGKLVKVDKQGWTRFLNRYCEGGYGSCNLKELNYLLNTKGMFYRREKKDVLKDLPEKQRQVVMCEITNRAEYDKAEAQFEAYLREMKGCTNAEIAKKMKMEMLVKMGILRQVAARGKLEAAQEYIDEVVSGGEKIVIFAHHKEIIRELKELYPDVVTVVGEDKPEQRHHNVMAFQNDSRVTKIACSLDAGGVGINLTAAPEILLIEQPWTDGKLEQAIDRVHRIGQIKHVRAGILLGKNTIDEYVYFNIILSKREISRQVVGSTESVNDEVVDDMLAFFDRKRTQKIE